MRYAWSSIALAIVLAVSSRVGAQTSLDIDRKVFDDARPRTALQKTMVPKGSVSIAKERPITSGAAPAELRVPIALQATDDKNDLKSVRVVEGKGTIAFQGGLPVLQQRQSGTTVLSSGQAKAIAETSMLTADAKTGLPWVVVDVVHEPPNNATPSHAPPTVRTARPFLLLARAVQWVPRTQRYVAEFIVGLDPEEGSVPGPLAEPFTASLSVSCDEVTPGSVQLDKMGPQGDHKVVVSCSPRVRLDGKPQHLNVRIASGLLSYPFELPAHPGAYALASSATQVLGLGLSTVRLTVLQAFEDGSPLVLDADTEVPLSSKTGELHPSVLTIPRGRSDASIDVRLYGLGPMNVHAGIGARLSSPLAIQRAWPLSFLLITVLGGAAGGYLAIIRQRRKKHEHSRADKILRRRVMEGSLVGVIAVGALLTTPGLADLMPDVARGSELAWFIAAVLAGFLGVELIEMLATRLVPKAEATEAS